MMTIDDLEYGIANYGTPLYVFDLDEIVDTAVQLRKETEGIAQICFAMKANPFLVRQMAEIADRIEVCSMGEYEICLERQIPPRKMLISGVLKERRDLERVLKEQKGACIYSVESRNQFCCIAKWCHVHKEPVRVYLRLTSGNQFGMDEQMIKDLITVRQTCPFVKIEGLHYFSGTQKRSSDSFRKELRRIDQLLCEIEEEYGMTIPDLEYGPGIEMPYFEGQTDKRAEDLEVLCTTIREMKWKGRVTLEMGRYLAAPAGYYLTGVRDIKRNHQKNYCIVDGGIHQLHYDGQIKGMYCPHLQVSPQREPGDLQEWTICGSLCTENDVLVRNLHIQGLKYGDILIFHRAGAYAMTEGMALFLSHSLPKAATYSKQKGWRLIRAEQPTFLWNMEWNIEKESDDGDIDRSFRGNR